MRGGGGDGIEELSCRRSTLFGRSFAGRELQEHRFRHIGHGDQNHN